MLGWASVDKKASRLSWQLTLPWRNSDSSLASYSSTVDGRTSASQKSLGDAPAPFYLHGVAKVEFSHQEHVQVQILVQVGAETNRGDTWESSLRGKCD